MTKSTMTKWLYPISKLNQGTYRSIALSLTTAIIILSGQNLSLASTPTPETANNNQTQTEANLPFGGLMPPLKRAIKDFQKHLGIEAEELIRVVLRLGERRVYVYEGEQELASYPVAVGKPGWETPTGDFEVIQLVENPRWQNPWTGEVMPAGPNTALGMRWIGFWSDGKDTIGFHGTPTVESIGSAASHGCVRMRNEDVMSLFEKVEVGTTVVVEP
ncbi:MAG: L,D-transpeptidase [Microcoleaceae cyanobacterium]